MAPCASCTSARCTCKHAGAAGAAACCGTHTSGFLCTPGATLLAVAVNIAECDVRSPCACWIVNAGAVLDLTCVHLKCFCKLGSSREQARRCICIVASTCNTDSFEWLRFGRPGLPLALPALLKGSTILLSLSLCTLINGRLQAASSVGFLHRMPDPPRGQFLFHTPLTTPCQSRMRILSAYQQSGRCVCHDC